MFLEDKKLQVDAESSNLYLFFNLLLSYIYSSSNGLAENTDFNTRVSITTRTHKMLFQRRQFYRLLGIKQTHSLQGHIHVTHHSQCRGLLQLLLLISSTDKHLVYCTSVLGRQTGELGDLKLASRTLKIMGYFIFTNNKPPFSRTGLPIFLHSPTLKNGLYNFQMRLPGTEAMLL